MKTKIKLEDVEEISGDIRDFSAEYWNKYCINCRHYPEYKENTFRGQHRCDVCKPRIAPPTRWREEP